MRSPRPSSQPKTASPGNRRTRDVRHRRGENPLRRSREPRLRTGWRKHTSPRSEEASLSMRIPAHRLATAWGRSPGSRVVTTAPPSRIARIQWLRWGGSRRSQLRGQPRIRPLSGRPHRDPFQSPRRSRLRGTFTLAAIYRRVSRLSISRRRDDPPSKSFHTPSHVP